MDFFINRPIFASVIALVMLLAGALSMMLMPVAQYPNLVPPQVQVSTQYIGASADVVSKTVTTPIEEDVNGVEGAIYMSSNSTNNGDSIINVTFEVGYDPSFAQVDVQNKTNQALPELPDAVSHVGVTVEKQSTNLVLIVNLISPKGRFDSTYLGNYADIHVYDALMRIPGTASINSFGLTKYAIRIWLDPAKLTNLGLSAMDVENAVKEQNQQVAAGKIGQAPAPEGQAFAFQLNTTGRLSQVEEFENIILRARPGGSVVRIKDVARVDLGSEEYDWGTKLNGQPSAALGLFQLSDANALDLYNTVVETMDALAKHFPEDLDYTIRYNTTTFVKESIHEVVTTLWQAILLVVLVVFVFLQSVRTTLIPIVAIPVSLIGTFAVMNLLGFSINTLSLLGLVLAVGLVVDDAIVVVENVTRKLQSGGGDLKEVTKEAMAEVRGPIIATTLVLMAVFIPVAFMPGMTGLLYNQFALTVAISVGFSGINSLTLSPALCGVLLRPQSGKKNVFFRAFNTAFDKVSAAYGQSVKILAKVWFLVVIAFIGLCFLAVSLFGRISTGFVPEEDQGYFIVNIELPDAASIQRTEAVMTQVYGVLHQIPGVADLISITGFNIIDSIKQPNAAVAFVVLDPWDERKTPELQVEGIMRRAQAKFTGIPAARIIAVNAPSIPGLGATGGFQFEIQDLLARGTADLTAVAMKFIDHARQRPELQRVYTTFSPEVPQRFLEIDRTKVKSLGVQISDVFDTLQINLGSLYVNEFNKFGRVYRVYLQADQAARAKENDVGSLRVRNESGDMIDLSAFLEIKPMVGPYNMTHYQLYQSVTVNGAPGPGHSSGEAVATMEELAADVLPEGYGHEWTGITYQQLKAGGAAPLIFALSLVFVFLVLAAQYESWAMPVMVLLAVPLGLLGAVGALLMRNLDLDVYGQIGLVMLIGLSAKNAILIVEFARDQRAQGSSIVEAAMQAARIRLRPILMTAFAFILGVTPLAIATGAGANARRSLGTTVIGGMAVATVLIIMVPIFYFVIQHIRERGKREKSPELAAGASGRTPPNESSDE